MVQFKVWDTEKKEIVHGGGIFLNGSGTVWINTRDGLEGVDNLVSTKRYEIILPILEKAKNGDTIFLGDIVEFNTYDSEENVTWLFRYEVLTQTEWKYLGGGIDFGTAYGKIDPIHSIISDMQNEDPQNRGFYIIGNNRQNPELLKKKIANILE